MSVRLEGKSRQILYGLAAFSLVGSAFSLFYFGYLGNNAPDPMAGPGTSITKIAGKNSPEIPLGNSLANLFDTDGKGDRADYLAAQIADARAKFAAKEPENKDDTASQKDNDGVVGFIAASLTPIDIGRAGPTRTAGYFRQTVNRGGKSDRIDQPVSAIRQASLTGPEEATQLPASIGDTAQDGNTEVTGEGVSAALFMISSSITPSAIEQKQAARLAEKNRPSDPKTSWSDMIKMARITGGDGEKIKSGIFGALTEDEFRAREFRCMATAIYFEARGESIKGQTAVAQVIMTRVRSDYYPNTICGVVYQGQFNRNACQFSFACDGKTDAPRNRKQWAVSIDVAKKVIAGEAYVDEVGAATHYHATYVSPKWRKMMKRVTRVGVHIFYKADFVRPLVASSELGEL